jgi:hypothetical protein
LWAEVYSLLLGRDCFIDFLFENLMIWMEILQGGEFGNST